MLETRETKGSRQTTLALQVGWSHALTREHSWSAWLLDVADSLALWQLQTALVLL